MCDNNITPSVQSVIAYSHQLCSNCIGTAKCTWKCNPNIVALQSECNSCDVAPYRISFKKYGACVNTMLEYLVMIIMAFI